MARISKPPGVATMTPAQKAAKLRFATMCECSHSAEWHAKSGVGGLGIGACAFPGCKCRQLVRP